MDLTKVCRFGTKITNADTSVHVNDLSIGYYSSISKSVKSNSLFMGLVGLTYPDPFISTVLRSQQLSRPTVSDGLH